MPEEHAFLSASGAHRWINCTPSAALEKQFPDTAGSYAAEGTLAHSLAELKLRKQFEIMKPSAYKQRLAEIQSDELYQREWTATQTPMWTTYAACAWRLPERRM